MRPTGASTPYTPFVAGSSTPAGASTPQALFAYDAFSVGSKKPAGKEANTAPDVDPFDAAKAEMSAPFASVEGDLSIPFAVTKDKLLGSHAAVEDRLFNPSATVAIPRSPASTPEEDLLFVLGMASGAFGFRVDESIGCELTARES